MYQLSCNIIRLNIYSGILKQDQYNVLVSQDIATIFYVSKTIRYITDKV